jgi:hypothetical protein
MSDIDYDALKIKIAEVNFNKKTLMRLSPRTLNCLRWLNFQVEHKYFNLFEGKNKVHTLGDLVKYQPKELLLIRNFGKKSLGEIEYVLNQYGLFLGMHIDETDTSLDWFAKELYEKFEMKGDGELFDELLEKAKNMQMKQTIDFTFNYLVQGFRDMGSLPPIEDFYNQQFKKNEKN